MKILQAVAKILNRREIQVQASILVQEAERAIAKATPPKKPGPKPNDNFSLPEDAEIKGSTLRAIRQAHSKISDSEYESIKKEFRANLEPLTRKQLLLQDQGKKKRGIWTLYFVEAEELGLIKIGKTQHPVADRLSSMQADLPDRLKLLCAIEYSLDVDLEGEVHSRFWLSREHGEWFRPTTDLTDYIDCLTEEGLSE